MSYAKIDDGNSGEEEQLIVVQNCVDPPACIVVEE